MEISRKFEIQNILRSYIMRIIKNYKTLPQNNRNVQNGNVQKRPLDQNVQKQPLEVFCEKSVFNSLVKFQVCNFIKKETPTYSHGHNILILD